MPINLQRLSSLIRKESIQLLRDRRLLLFVLGLPIIELIFYGYAAHLTVYHIPLAVADQSRDRASRELVQALVNSQYFDLTTQLGSQAEVTQAIGRGDVKAGLVIPPDFAARLARHNADVLILLDGSDTASVQSGYSAAALVAQSYSVQLAARQVAHTVRSSAPTAGSSSGLAAPASARQARVVASTQVLYNPDMIDIWFILPGLVGLILQTLAITQAALIVVRDRELGTIEPILATPIRPLELMVSKLVPLLVLCLVATAIVVGAGMFWFRVPFAGSLILYFGLSTLFIAACLGLGLLVSTRSATQMDASVSGNMFMLVGILMSGFIYPLSAMPVPLQVIGSLFPVTYFIRISRGIILKGVGLRFVWTDALVLLGYSLVVIVLAARSFRPRLD
jgi:ABC-2 type transport system permease protein